MQRRSAVLPYRQENTWSWWSVEIFGMERLPDGMVRVAFYYLQVSRAYIEEGEQTVTVVDLNAIAPQIALKDGQINPDGTLQSGPGELMAWIDAEAGTARVKLRDGTEAHLPCEDILVIRSSHKKALKHSQQPGRRA
jgi:hypothetical protein